MLEEIALGKFSGFNKTLQKSGLTPKILSAQLKEMEALSLVKRVGAKPAKYEITERGRELKKIISQIKTFNKKWENTKLCEDRSCLECEQFS